jgi:hypothetical protein
MKRASRNILAVLILLSAVLLSFAPPAPAQDRPSAPPSYLYKTSFVRAAPGKLLELIDLLKSRMPVHDAAGDERPLWWRHTQGDQWDLMLLLPMGSYTEYYSAERIAKRKAAADASRLSQADFLDRLNTCSSWKEDLFVTGPPLEKVKPAFLAAAYYHIEIMVSQPGKQAELYRERVRENIYQTEIGRPEIMIFVRDQGASWDIYTLGCYRDLAHWADSSGATREQREAAARKAGFKSPDEIGPYMRTLIDMHRDTMGVAIK